MINLIITQILWVVGWLMLASFCWFILTGLASAELKYVPLKLHHTPFCSFLMVFITMSYVKAGGIQVLVIATLLTVLMMLITSHWYHRVLFYRTLAEENIKYTQALEQELQILKSTSLH